ncbi:MAG: lysophospholipid acyltransferase family protein, partial [Myxococcota bacterium]
RAMLPGYLSRFVADESASAHNRSRIGAMIAAWSDDQCQAVTAELAHLGDEHRLYRALPFARELAREWARDVLVEPELSGVEHLAAAAASGPTMLVGNHLSYFDTTATDAVLTWKGHGDLADRLVAAAGPKVYQELFRLFAAACLNTLPVPQSTSFAHTEKLSPRELARKATESMASSKALLDAGLLLLVYPEGSRSRTGRFGPFLRGIHRYLSCTTPLSVVPIAIAGTERVMPVADADTRLFPGRVAIRFAPAIRVGVDGAPREALDAAHRAVAALLPEHLRPLASADETA